MGQQIHVSNNKQSLLLLSHVSPFNILWNWASCDSIQKIIIINLQTFQLEKHKVSIEMDIIM